MLVIRFRRAGKRNYAQYKIVVAEKSASIKGKFVEVLGSHDPHSKQTVLKDERIKYWLGTGAQCSNSVHNLLVSKGLIKGDKRKVSIKEKEKEGTEEVPNQPVQGAEEADKPADAPADAEARADKEAKEEKKETSKEDEAKEEVPQDAAPNQTVQGAEEKTK